MIDSNPTETARHWLRPPKADAGPRRMALRPRRVPVFAITSGQRGSGKTTIVANLAAALTRRQKQLLAIDADLGNAQLGGFFAVEPTHSLTDFLRGEASLDEVISERGDGLFLLPGAADLTGLSALQKLALASDLEALDQRLDMVLIDTGSGVNDAVTYFASAAQEILVVVTPGPSGLSESYALLEALAHSRREKHFHILANRVSDRAEALRLFDPLSAAALRGLNCALDLIGWIPDDQELAQAAARNETLLPHDLQAPAARALTTLADRLIESSRREAPLKGNLQFFLRRRLGEDRCEA